MLLIIGIENITKRDKEELMKVLIVGAGGQGGSCASILSRQDCVEEIRLADLKEETAIAIAEQIDSAKVRTYA